MKPVIIKLLILAIPSVLTSCKSDSEGTRGSGRPNILIAMGDGISYPHMSAYGTKWVKTPGFDMVARNGIVFYNAYTPVSISSPSRASFLTGRNPWQLEDAANHMAFFPARFKSFIEALEEEGYYAGYTAKGWGPGVAADSAGNPRSLTGRAFNDKKITPPAEGISDNDYAGNFEDFLDNRPEGKPFCFWYGSEEPHRKYEYGSGVNKGGKNTAYIPRVPGFWPDNRVVRTDMLDYAFEIEHFDNHLVKMIDLLSERGELSNTIVIVTADNGMPFPRVKGQAYEYSNHVPLAIMWKDGIKRPGRRSFDFISLIDFAPTLLETAGIGPGESGMHEPEGNSFTGLLRTPGKKDPDKSRDYVLIGRERNEVGRPGDEGYPVRGIIHNTFLYLRNYSSGRWPSGNPETGYLDCEGSPVKSLILSLRRSGTTSKYWNLSYGMRGDEELYDIGKDPECLVNLINNPGFASVWQELRQRMFSLLMEQGDPRVSGKGDVFDKYPYALENQRDFYNRFMRGELNYRDADWVDSTDFEIRGR